MRALPGARLNGATAMPKFRQPDDTDVERGHRQTGRFAGTGSAGAGNFFRLALPAAR